MRFRTENAAKQRFFKKYTTFSIMVIRIAPNKNNQKVVEEQAL